MAASWVILCFGATFYVVMGMPGQTSENFRKELTKLIDECGEELDFTYEDEQTVLYLKENFSPAAKCLVACTLEKVNLMKDGHLTPPEVQIVNYTYVWADEPTRMETAERVLRVCYDEITNAQYDDYCEEGYAFVPCTDRETYSEQD